MSYEGKYMKKFFLFVFVIILVISLVPLSGVNAQRTTPAFSASMSAASAPAARATYTKTVKTKVAINDGATNDALFKYVQKITWGYDYSTIKSVAHSTKGVLIDPFWLYLGSALVSTSGGKGKTYYSLQTKGEFLFSPSTVTVWINIKQKVFADGTWKQSSYAQITP